MDVARLGHLELLTPTPKERLRFFVDTMGMTEPGRATDIFLEAGAPIETGPHKRGTPPLPETLPE